MYQGVGESGEKFWGCVLCSYSHKELVAFLNMLYILVLGSVAGPTLFFSDPDLDPRWRVFGDPDMDDALQLITDPDQTVQVILFPCFVSA